MELLEDEVIIDSGGVHSVLPLERHWANSRWEAWWKGFLCVPPYSSGEESIEEFTKVCDRSSIANARALLRGQFFLAVCHKESGTWQAFVDTGGMFYAFRSADRVSTSFIDLVAAEKLTVRDADPAALVEFLTFGYVHEGRTFFEQIRRIGAHEIVTVSSSFVDNGASSCLKLQPSPAPAIDHPPGMDLQVLFDSLVPTLSRERLSVDLTGGVDSRMVAVLAHHGGLEFETTIAGKETHVDVRLSRRVAAALDRPHRLSVHDIADLEADLDGVFRACDGLSDVLSFHRVYQHQRRRAERGITLALGGLGGELFKDTHWLHDLPFYNRRRANLPRFANLRMLKFRCDDWLLSPAFRPANAEIRARVTARLEAYRKGTNTQTYDTIAYYFTNTAEVGRSVSNSSAVLPVYSPLVELDGVRFAYQLRRRRRFFNNYHRQVVTSQHPAAAAIGTSASGMTCSSHPAALMLDSARFFYGNVSWVANVVARRALHRPYGSASINHPDLMSKARSLPQTRRALAFLQSAGILADDVRLDQIRDLQLGRCVTLAMLLDDRARQH